MNGHLTPLAVTRSQLDTLGRRAAPLRDALTDLLTRQALLGQLEAESGSGRSGDWLALLDIDGMRGVNERIGQSRGDQVLRAASAAAKLIVAAAWPQAAERIARYEGDALLIAGRSTRREAEGLAEALRRGLAATTVAGVSITCSIGVAERRIGEPLDATLARAEQSLHLAKQFGRDCVEFAVTPEQRPAAAQIHYLGR